MCVFPSFSCRWILIQDPESRSTKSLNTDPMQIRIQIHNHAQNRRKCRVSVLVNLHFLLKRLLFLKN
jgi:hypothetical protein